MKKTPSALVSWSGVIVVMMTLAANAVAVEPAPSRQDRKGPVTVTATLIPSVTGDGPLRVRVVLDTHSTNLDGLAFETIVALRGPDGKDVEPLAVEQAKGSGHHREAVVVFRAPAARGGLRVVVKNVGGVSERIFTWELPAGR